MHNHSVRWWIFTNMKSLTTPTPAVNARNSILAFFARDLDVIRKTGTQEQIAELPEIEQRLAVLLAPTSGTFQKCAKDYEAEGKHDLANLARSKACELQTAARVGTAAPYSPEYWDKHRQNATQAGKLWDAYSYGIQMKKALIGERLNKLGFGNASNNEQAAMLADLLEKAHPNQRAALLRKYAKLRHAERVEMASLPMITANGRIIC
jgi:hypothetical protein